MRFSCSKKELNKALSIVSKATATKMPKTVLECIYFLCDDHTVTLMATNLELYVKITLQSDVKVKGSAAVPVKLLLSIINSFPDRDVEFNQTENTKVKISCAGTDVSLMLFDESEFPRFPDISPRAEFEIKKNTLKNMVDMTVFSISQSQDRPIFTGILFDADKDTLALVAIDGYRMAIRKEPIEAFSGTPQRCVLPGQPLRDITRALEPTDDIINIGLCENMAYLIWEGAEIYSRLIDGEYINYENILPKDFKIEVQTSVPEFKQSVERAAILAQDGSNNVVKLHIHERAIDIYSNTNSGDNLFESVPSAVMGGSLNIAFNANFILDVLKNVKDEEIIMLLNEPVTPCVMKKENSDEYSYMILPVQLH